MKPLVIVPFHRLHMAEVIGQMLRDEDRYLTAFREDLERIGWMHERSGPAITFDLKDTGAVCCVGIDVLWHGVGEVWMLTSSMVRTDARLRLRIALGLARRYRTVWSDYNLHRLQASVMIDDVVTQALLDDWGFTFEAPMRAYGPDGSTFYRFAAFAPWLEGIDDGSVQRRNGAAQARGNGDQRVLESQAGLRSAGSRQP